MSRNQSQDWWSFSIIAAALLILLAGFIFSTVMCQRCIMNRQVDDIVWKNKVQEELCKREQGTKVDE